jgi:hypothetical protein
MADAAFYFFYERRAFFVSQFDAARLLRLSTRMFRASVPRRRALAWNSSDAGGEKVRCFGMEQGEPTNSPEKETQ